MEALVLNFRFFKLLNRPNYLVMSKGYLKTGKFCCKVKNWEREEMMRDTVIRKRQKTGWSQGNEQGVIAIPWLVDRSPSKAQASLS